MSMFDKETQDKADAMKKEIIKAIEFENGLVLKAVSVEKIKGQFGASDENKLVEAGILEEGQQFLFKFLSEDGTMRRHYSTSMPLFRGFTGAEVEPGDWVSIKREGKGEKTKYTVTRVPHDDFLQENNGHRDLGGLEYPKDDINPNDIPF